MGSMGQEKLRKIMDIITDREKKEHAATAEACTADTLRNLNVYIENFPQKCQKLLQEAAIKQYTLGFKLDPVLISQIHCQQIKEEIEDDEEISKLEKMNATLRIKIDRNKIEIESLKEGLAEARMSLKRQTPNVDNIQEEIRALKQKVASYEENCEKARMKFTKLCVADELFPKSLDVLASQLATLQVQEAELKERVDDINFTHQVRCKLTQLRH